MVLLKPILNSTHEIGNIIKFKTPQNKLYCFTSPEARMAADIDVCSDFKEKKIKERITKELQRLQSKIQDVQAKLQEVLK